MGADRLEQAASARDADEVELALNDALVRGLKDRHVTVLTELLAATWHTRHEDVVRALQRLRLAGPEVALERRARDRHELDTIDEGLAVARKCTWALADIGSEEARRALERLSHSSDSEVAAFAIKRLDSWTAESHRKGR